MNKRKLFLFVLPFLLLAFNVVAVSLRRQALQAERDARQERFLNLRFSSVKLQNGKIVMTPTTQFGRAFPYKQSRTLSIGDKFEYFDRHWNGTYLIKGIGSDGVAITYHYDGLKPAYPGSWSGSAKIRWK